MDRPSGPAAAIRRAGSLALITTIKVPQSASSGHVITATTDVGVITVAPSL